MHTVVLLAATCTVATTYYSLNPKISKIFLWEPHRGKDGKGYFGYVSYSLWAIALVIINVWLRP